ncbi:patatin-like phospholipase family protein [Lutibaculum baratangense]|uniref:UPF0028 protein YchK n=1 Tax=Lutibaculum baratangense AMV1 TaxID=631454 RepID=V4TGB1_9HYPH|nr:patatin-like phospholipase family protein [Lutibaculum baratangense]ESR25158.1 UPF0028 protein YchK [Lutibaculum baratangense AMV1]
MFQTLARRMSNSSQPTTKSTPGSTVRDAPPPQKATIGIALGGGAARGWAHIGVLRTLEAAGYAPSVIAGTSIGSVVGGFYAAKKLDDLEEFALSLTRRRIFGLMDFTLRGSGLLSGSRLGDLLDEALGDVRVESLDRRFCAVACELKSGHEMWLSQGRLTEAMRASYSLPGVFRPMRLNGRWLIDGALVNPIPVSVCRAMGARLVIAVNLHSDVFGRGTIVPWVDAGDAPAEEESGGLDSGPTVNSRLMRRQMFGNSDGAPGISTVVGDAFNITQDRIARARLAGDPPDVMVGPRMRRIGLFEFHRAREAIAAGMEAAEKCLGEIAESSEALSRLDPG